MSLIHEVPTALRTRPTVAIRQLGKVFRVPARGGTILLSALIIWGVASALLPLSWNTLAALILLPAVVLIALVEARPRGKTPLSWGYIVLRHLRRPQLLSGRRVVTIEGSRRERPRRS